MNCKYLRKNEQSLSSSPFPLLCLILFPNSDFIKMLAGETMGKEKALHVPHSNYIKKKQLWAECFMQNATCFQYPRHSHEEHAL